MNFALLYFTIAYVIQVVLYPIILFIKEGHFMDRRQQKTRAAIFEAFSALLSEKPYSKITIQNIIDRANIGRSTFYAHFQTKDSLLEDMCQELFEHIVDGVMNDNHPSDDHQHTGLPDPVFCHLLEHIAENTNHLRDLLISESSDFFLRYFKASLSRLIASYLLNHHKEIPVPEDFLLNHISGSFVEMVQWWVRKNKMQATPKELNAYFQTVIEPLL